MTDNSSRVIHKNFVTKMINGEIGRENADDHPLKITEDPRITRVGKVLRQFSLDEFPQLINVLKGDMSLIGPRPERPHFHDEFSKTLPLFERRLGVRPGVTSLSHVLGSYSSEPSDRLRYDLIYMSSMSLFTDLRILVATIRVVLGAKGAR